MTARTHDLGAFTAINLVFIFTSITQMTLATLLVSMGANFIGGLAPDLDNQSSQFWKRFRGGSLWSRIITPLLGGHRMISHSLLGLMLAGALFKGILELSSEFIIIDQSIVWWSFIIGFISHLGLDSLTRQGIPIFFPLHNRIGFPPHKKFRIKTGGLIEKSLLFPLLLGITIWLFWRYHNKYLELINLILRSQ